MTTPYLRLRQICLAAPALEPCVAAIGAVFGLQPCHRDPNVAHYGLENALFAFGNQFVEVVAPIADGTAVQRFIERSGGQGGYMAIFDCHDPGARRDHAGSLGVRVAHEIDRPGYRGVQLHPKDCRAAMLEFDHTIGGEEADGPYWPAGPHWQSGRDATRVAGIPVVELASPDAEDLAGHWSRLTQTPLVRDRDGTALLRFTMGSARFVAGSPERLAALTVEVANPAACLQAAREQGLPADGASFALAGMRFDLVPLIA